MLVGVIAITLRLSLYSVILKKQPPEVFYKNAILKNFAIFTGKHLFWSLFLIKLQV